MNDDDNRTWKTVGRIGLVVTIIVGVLSILQFFNPLAKSSQTSANSAGATSPGSSTPTQTLSLTNPTAVIPLPSATATARPITPGTVICRANGSVGWNGWSLGSSWHLVGNALLNDGSDNSGTYSPNLIPPDSCQGQVADVAIKASIKVDSLGSGGFGLDTRGQNTSDGWAGYSFWMYVACYDPANSMCLTPNLYAVLHDPEENQLSSGQYAVGSSYHTYELDARGNSITVKIDGATIFSPTDNHFLNPGQVGIFCKNNTQVEVQSVDVVAL